MSEKYFDKWQFDQAFNLVETNPLEAKNRYENYLKEYPNDYATYPYYAYVLITLGEFDQAEKVINYVDCVYCNDHGFLNKPSRVDLLKHNIFYNRLRLLSYMEKYDELYNICSVYQKEIQDMDLNSLDFYTKGKVGMLNVDMRNIHAYLFKQIIEYSENEFIQHIEKHMTDYNMNVDNPNTSLFSPDFPVDRVVKEIKKYLLSDNRMYPGFYHDRYVFKYNDCGRVNNRNVDFFEVSCFHNTMNFITMYPSSSCKFLPYIDLNYLSLDKKETKVRKLSQIDKFNARFGKK